jgi:serine/threonine protein kinase/formylglycine-generating enzyme required for sulfatase activity
MGRILGYFTAFPGDNKGYYSFAELSAERRSAQGMIVRKSISSPHLPPVAECGMTMNRRSSLQPMPPQHKYSLPLGLRLRQYRIVRLLGHGGFGLTYLAEDTTLNRRVAIKELLPIDFAVREKDGTTIVARSQQDKPNLEWARQRFVEEGRTLAALQHPSILPVYDNFELHGTAYLVTPFIDGASLEVWLLERRAVSQADLLSIATSLLDALRLVHQQGFLHRDIKPENILMDRKTSRPVLIDFGNARMATGKKTSNLTAVLSRGYAPFEQYQTKTRQGPPTDIYALGAVLYRAIKGAAPDDALDRMGEDKIKVLSRERMPGFTREFLATIDKALRMRPEDRWQNCGEWKAALAVTHQTHRHQQPNQTQEPQPPQQFLQAPRRFAISLPKPSKSVLALAAAALGLLALVLLGVGIGRWTNRQPEEDKSNTVTPILQETASANTPSSSTSVKLPFAARTPRPFPTPPIALPSLIAPSQGAGPGMATAYRPYVNSLGQEFVPAGTRGVLFCKTHVRVSDYREFVNATNRDMSGGIMALKWKKTGNGHYATLWELDAAASWNNPGFQQDGTHPVAGVSLEDARAFCAWLTEKERRSGSLPAGAVYRLPTDDEWTMAAGPARYPWGENWPPRGRVGNYADASFAAGLPGKNWPVVPGLEDGWAGTSPVGTYIANPYGLFDMGGNLWQWCDTQYKPSMNSPAALKALPILKTGSANDGTPFWVSRGGSWYNFIQATFQSSYRNIGVPNFRCGEYGFRCVMAFPG